MKLRTTTPASISKIAKSVLILSVILIAVAVPLQMTQKVSADQYDEKINALQQEINQYQAEGNRLNSQADTLQTALSQLSSQRATIQAQIDLSQAKYDKLVQQIADTEKQIKDNQDALGVTIANMYVDGMISPIEMLASSKTISEFLDKQEYQSSIRDQLTSTINKIKDLKTLLNTQKADVSKILEDQKSQRDQLVAKQNEQQTLLSETQGQEAAYQQLIGKNQAAIDEARATQAMLNSRISGSGGGSIINGGLLSAYPWNNSNCSMLGYWSTGGSDGNGGDGYGYGCRQCASYVAWKIAKVTNFYPSWGNAVNFTSNAQARFGAGDGQPHPGSIAVMDPSTAGVSEGHVAWVETEPYVSDGRTVIQVSQYNYNYGAGYGMYSLMELSVNAFDHYVQIVK